MTATRRRIRNLIVAKAPRGVTALQCQAPHPVQRVAHRRHLAHLGVAHGRWEPTGEVLIGDDGRRAVPRPDRVWAWCQKCRAASEYRRVG